MKTFSLPNFTLTSTGPISKSAINAGFKDYYALIDFIKTLPYGRIKNINQIFTSQKATCSTKHAFLKSVADEHKHSDIKLIIGIYRMTQSNTPGIGDAMTGAEIDYLLEAHCYLSYRGIRMDYTTPRSDIKRIESDILHEVEINPSQIGKFKVELHRAFLDQWRSENKLNLTLEDLWLLREQCIANLSN